MIIEILAIGDVYLCCLLCLAAGWEEQLASPPKSPETTKSALDCSWPYAWVTGVLACLLLFAAVAVVILAVILAVLWRRARVVYTCKCKHMQQYESSVGNIAPNAGLLAPVMEY